MSRKIRLTETELTNLIKRVVQEQANSPIPGVKGMGSSTDVQQSKKKIPFETIQEYMSHEFNAKNNQKISVVLTFDGQNVVANLRGTQFVVTRN
jgi:hypothetical protein